MYWEDKGYLLSKLKYSENSIIANFFTSDHGKFSGIIYGATSKKNKGYLQIGNVFHLNCNIKNEARIPTLKVEIINAITPTFFENQKKLYCISSAMSMIKFLTVENQTNKKIFYLINDFFTFLKKDNWIKNYIIWELNLLKEIGYDLDLKNIVNKETTDNKTTYFVQSSSQKKEVPTFLVDTQIENVDKKDLLKGFLLLGNYLEKKILSPNNIKIPNSRTDFLNLVNNSL